MKRRLTVVTIFLVLFLISCTDGRPDAVNAEKQFKRHYPEVEVLSVHISEDEVVARSFKFRYRKPGDQKEKEIEIQFMKNQNSKKWETNPKPPKELP